MLFKINTNNNMDPIQDKPITEPFISGIFNEQSQLNTESSTSNAPVTENGTTIASESKTDPATLENKPVSKDDLKDRLRQKMKTQKMQRNNNNAQRSILKQANIPENLMDNAMNALRQKNTNPLTNALQTMMSQLATMPKEKKMKAPNVELPKDKMKTPDVDF